MTCATRRRSTRARRREHAAHLEIASNSLASALAAQAGGADRIELFDNLAEGGTTPSFATIAIARERLSIPLFVLVRPRPGDFHYDALETELMLRDIAQCRALGCDGVVIGALDVQGNIDLPLCRELVQAAGPLQVTFHRAFDAARDLPAALEQVIGLGCQRVLTSGARQAPRPVPRCWRAWLPRRRGASR